ncbi:DUF4202 domain-containing protein [Simiduia sp. 21SJ11W-1]|uniref:DUF4202 domain-containing protein n=1 Tax=Simiduia sp. 21SJ11W-1 TaxID=2909669 RepID=UPI0020A01FEC|nr:DUF4202 domain-containing protein [Simiduia sp. 21SJ11W-1]UTA46393.1 DUF4202 domain-containing protein [Simiduia sp. 21SJ11W-1]
MFSKARAFEAIDAINAQDPKQETVNGESLPAALLYGQRMSARLASFQPEASLALAIACRAQHIERWIIPRTDYPMDRGGYHRWRTALGRHHAERTQALVAELGADTALIDTLGQLLRKEALKQNPQTQALEDVACLVFIEHYLQPFSEQHDEAKLVSIIQKTWRKMSAAGQAAALALPLHPTVAPIIKKALNGADGAA